MPARAKIHAAIYLAVDRDIYSAVYCDGHLDPYYGILAPVCLAIDINIQSRAILPEIRLVLYEKIKIRT